MISELPRIETYSEEEIDRVMTRVKDALYNEKSAILQLAKTAGDQVAATKQFREKWLGRKHGLATQANQIWLKSAAPVHKRAAGAAVNSLRRLAETALQELEQQFATSGKRAADHIDITLPGIRRPLGAEHPIIRTMNEVVAVFKAMGYSVAEGPEIESDYFNFEALNFPPNHPARDTQDTLFIAGQERRPQRDRLVLRTHTSPVQIRAMMQSPPPLRIVCPGKVHRRDAADATHSPMFHQLECLAVDTNITFSDLKGTLDHMCKSLFGSSVKTRFQPSFFPFTEPSAEVYVSCPFCGAKGCRICKQSGWIELGGSGMVHPNVFEAVRDYGYDPAKISGFAFGMGIDRMAALRWDIHDIQLFFEGDMRFLEQFS